MKKIINLLIIILTVIFNFNINLIKTNKLTQKCNHTIRTLRIKFLKKNMAPIRMDGRLFLKTPNVFKLKYIFKNGRQHPFLNKIKRCALMNMQVDYTPDGSYMTYDDGSMTSYNVTMTFGELNPIYQEDFDSSNDMGF